MPEWNPEVNRLFADALEIGGPTERSRFLDEQCHGDVALRASIEELLAANGRAGDFLETPATGVRGAIQTLEAPGLAPASLVGFIGPYRLVEGIGVGGFGAVYLAEQLEPVRRQVALKLIRPGMDSREVITRFEAERQALAMMDHPNICRVLDCGATDARSPIGAGRPYFVMELVRGVPITRYCAERRLAARERLDLFADVCHAVQHAHQKGVIHRDLKPSNILVTTSDGGSAAARRGVPKIIDFGIAKAVAGRLTDATLLTDARQMIGTPAYMSPEQAGLDNLDVDTRSDIYSLGVLLYEMLTGTTPFDPDALREASYDDMRRMIREVEPPKPSTRLAALESGTAENEGSVGADARSAERLLRGDLDWIVMKCLEKDRARRYDTASALADDLRRHVAGEAVIAAPPSRLYRMSRTLRRHAAAVSVVGAFLLLLGIGLVATSMLWRQAAHARDAESDQRARAEAIGAFLKEMLTAATPAMARGRNLTVREALETAAAQIDSGALAARPLVEAEIRFTIGSTYRALGLLPEAETQLRAAAGVRSRELGDEHPDTMRTRFELARTLVVTDYVESAAIAQATLDSQRRVLGPDHPDTVRSMVVLGVARAWAGEFADAESLLLAALEWRQRTVGDDDAETAYFLNRLGQVYTHFSQPERAEPLHREALRIHAQALGDEHPDTIGSTRLLESALLNQRRAEEAESIGRMGLAASLRVLGPDHAETLAFQSDLAGALALQSRHAEAQAIYRDTLAAQVRTEGPGAHDTLTTQRLLAGSLAAQGQSAEAERLLRDALDASRGQGRLEDAAVTASIATALASVLSAQRKDEEAELVATQAIERLRRDTPHPDSGDLHDASRTLIRLLRRRGAEDDAMRVERALIEFLAAAASAEGATVETLHLAAWNLLYPADERLRDASQALRFAQRANERSGGRDPRDLRTLARASMATGDSARAIEAWEDAVARSPDDRSRAATLNAAAWELLNATPESLRDPRRALEFAQRSNELGGYRVAAHLDTLALAHHRNGESVQAVALEERAIALLAPDDPDRADYEAQLREFRAACEPGNGTGAQQH